MCCATALSCLSAGRVCAAAALALNFPPHLATCACSDAYEVCSLIPATDERGQVRANPWGMIVHTNVMLERVVFARYHPKLGLGSCWPGCNPIIQCYSVFGLDANRMAQYYDAVLALEGALSGSSTAATQGTSTDAQACSDPVWGPLLDFFSVCLGSLGACLALMVLSVVGLLHTCRFKWSNCFVVICGLT